MLPLVSAMTKLLSGSTQGRFASSSSATVRGAEHRQERLERPVRLGDGGVADAASGVPLLRIADDDRAVAGDGDVDLDGRGAAHGDGLGAALGLEPLALVLVAGSDRRARTARRRSLASRCWRW